MLQVDHIAAAHLQKTILGQNGRQLLQLAVKGAEMFPRNVPIHIDDSALALQIIDLVQRDANGLAVVVHGEGLGTGLHHGRIDVLQTAGQLLGDVPFEDVAVGVDLVAIQRKGQIGRYIDQADVRIAVPELAAQCNAVDLRHVHIQECNAVQLQVRDRQHLLRVGTDRSLHRDLVRFKVSRRILRHLRAEGGIVVADKNVHPELLSVRKGSS